MSQPAEPWGLSVPVRELLAATTQAMTLREIAEAVDAHGCSAEVRKVIHPLVKRGLVAELTDPKGGPKRYLSIAHIPPSPDEAQP